MFWLIKKVFFVSLIFCGSLATNCVSLNNEKCMNRLTVNDLNPIELKNYHDNYHKFISHDYS